jgi:hypothetical protein
VLSLEELKTIQLALTRLVDMLNARMMNSMQTPDPYEYRLRSMYGEDARLFTVVKNKFDRFIEGWEQKNNAEKMVEALNLDASQDGEKRAEALFKRVTDDLRLLDLLLSSAENVKGSVASYRTDPDMRELRSGIIGMKVFFSQLVSLHKNSAKR